MCEISFVRMRTKGSAIAIGNFDGFHRGHQLVISELKKIAKKEDLKSLVLTFSPHPFVSHSARLTTETQKNEFFKRLGVAVTVLDFKRFCHLTPEEFARKILIEKLKMKYAVVGENFRFGYQRKGDKETLKELGGKYNFGVKIVPLLKEKGKVISSGYIRKCIEEDKIEVANRLLGRNYELWGKVISGVKRGRKLGFPTANLKLNGSVLLPRGVFLAKVSVNGQCYPGVANVGNRPTFSHNSRPAVEVHLLSLPGELYNKVLRLSLLKRIRPEKKFFSVFALRKQIESDINQAKQFFSKNI